MEQDEGAVRPEAISTPSLRGSLLTAYPSIPGHELRVFLLNVVLYLLLYCLS